MGRTGAGDPSRTGRAPSGREGVPRLGGRVLVVVGALVAGLLVGPGVAVGAPASPAAVTPAPVTPAPWSTVSRAPAGPAAPVASPAAAARAAFGAAGSLMVLVGPQDPFDAPGTTADAVARGADGVSSAGDVDDAVPTASLVKLYLAEGVLAAARATGTTVPAQDLARIEAMLTSSDDQAASDLWVAHDGVAVLADVVDRYGLTGTAPAAPDPGAWGSTTTTATDLARFLTRLPVVAHPADADLVLDALSRATALGSDGFDQSFGLLGPGRAADVAAKQGWMCCVDGLRHLHSVGLQDGRVVVLLAAFPADVDWAVARAALDAAAGAVSR